MVGRRAWRARETRSLLLGIAKHGRHFSTVARDVEFSSALRLRDSDQCKVKWRNIYKALLSAGPGVLPEMLQDVPVPAGPFVIGPSVGGPPAFRNWPADRTDALKDGVARYGNKRWDDIKNDEEFNPMFLDTTPRDMKAKWGYLQDVEAAEKAIELLEWMLEVQQQQQPALELQQQQAALELQQQQAALELQQQQAALELQQQQAAAEQPEEANGAVAAVGPHGDMLAQELAQVAQNVIPPAPGPEEEKPEDHQDGAQGAGVISHAPGPQEEVSVDRQGQEGLVSSTKTGQSSSRTNLVMTGDMGSSA